jgi:hypothetical protein
VRNLLQGMVDLQGDKVSPLITYTFSDSNSTGYDGHVIPCSEQCFCAYCSDACSKGPKLEPDYSCKIFNMSCINFGIIILSVLVGLFVIAFITAIIQRWFKWYRNISDVPSKSTPINARERLLRSDQANDMYAPYQSTAMFYSESNRDY